MSEATELDALHAKEIRSLASALNYAMDHAYRKGLAVTVTVRGVAEDGRADTCPQLRVEVLRPLL